VVLPLSEARGEEEDDEDEVVLYVGPWSDCLPLGGEPSHFRVFVDEDTDEHLVNKVQKRSQNLQVHRVQKRSGQPPASTWPEPLDKVEQWPAKPAKTIFPPPKVGWCSRG
jgi:hypothetical protein